MKTFFIIKTNFIFIFFLLILNSCGLYKEKVIPDESSVLSGPPLAIPPEFDIDISPNNVGGTEPVVILENGADENVIINTFESSQDLILNEDSGYFTESNAIQSFENYNISSQKSSGSFKTESNQIQSQRNNKRATVPSDSYNFGKTRYTNLKNRTKKVSRSFFGTNSDITEDIETLNNSDELSQDELNLLEDIFKTTTSCLHH